LVKVKFLGTGTATCEKYSNTSVLIETKKNILLDCGSQIPEKLWKYNSEKDFLDIIFISHTHGDHFGGIPSLLLKMIELGRKKELTILCSYKNKKEIEKLNKLLFNIINDNLKFKIKYITFSEEENKITIDSFNFHFAKTNHGTEENFAVRIENGNKIICYSGDGNSTKESEKLFINSNLLIHECFSYDENKPDHTSFITLKNKFQNIGIKCLALVHINHNFRLKILKEINIGDNENLKMIVPEKGEELKF
jgi:ribonuclease Z